MTVIIILASVLFDQLTKYLVLNYIKPQVSVPLIDGVLNFTYHENRGAFLGAFSDNRWVFLIASSVAIIAMIVYLFISKNDHILVRLSIALLIGGGIGNMIDRVALGYVVDFIDAEIIHFPIFNVADSFVTIGAGILIFYLIFIEMRKPDEKKDPDMTAFDIPLNIPRSEENAGDKSDVIIESDAQDAAETSSENIAGDEDKAENNDGSNISDGE